MPLTRSQTCRKSWTILTLPSEIRAIIFQYVIGPSSVTLRRDLFKIHRRSKNHETGVALRLTCRQFYVETLPRFASLINLELANGVRPTHLSLTLRSHYIQHIQNLALKDDIIRKLDLSLFPSLQSLDLQTPAFSYRTDVWPIDDDWIMGGGADADCQTIATRRLDALAKSHWLRQTLQDEKRTFGICVTAVFNLPPHKYRGWNEKRLVSSTSSVTTPTCLEKLTSYRSLRGTPTPVMSTRGSSTAQLVFGGMP